MIIVKVYKYDSAQEANGYRGTDYSAHLLQGNEFTEDITQELDTCEITLSGLNFEKEFDPQTKFIIDYYQDSEANMMTRHWLVAKDMVQKPILSDDNYFDHHISLIEPSVIAQQRLVDNISATYKLKDVNLEEVVQFDIYEKAASTYENSQIQPERNFGYFETGHNANDYGYWTFGKYFQAEGKIEAVRADTSTSDNKYNNIADFQVGSTHETQFTLPKIAIYGGVQGSKNYTKIGYASIDYLIEKMPLNDLSNATQVASGSIIENQALNRDYYVPSNAYRFAMSGADSHFLDEWITECGWGEEGSTNYGFMYRKYVDTTSQTTPIYETDTITVEDGYIYKVTISLHQFNDDVTRLNFQEDASFKQVWSKNYNNITPTAWANQIKKYYRYDFFTILDNFGGQNSQILGPKSTNFSIEYVFYSGTTKQILYTSSIPYSALTLLQKAIINSNIYEKIDGIYINNINSSNTPFYIDNAYIDKLNATQVIENFYNQKNLWEIMIEVGHYIHAIPELKFGADDKFMITFNELGRTDQQIDKGTKISIMNSRGVEDYISSTSSYISNMVQLGGTIEEWVIPKTSSEDFLIYNDTAELKTTKPIIELLEVTVRCDETYTSTDGTGTTTINAGDTADLTPYIYEKNVYDLLGIDKYVVPDKGIAMYYELGTNKITGGNYRLPQSTLNTISGDYAFKKIIWCAFKGYPGGTFLGDIGGFWSKLIVNNFSFFIKYRTKDDVRQTHTRPDLRKYLLNSQFDRYPQHNQFNNQTDTLVDSIKFGNNMFGKLIKTGNTSYEITEWHNNIDAIKKKGELYKIGSELYYVAKVKHIWFHSYILSQVTFSKDYNELSAIIGIPSEPRFYEISEQSLIKREVAINDLILLTDDLSQINFMATNSFLHTYDHLKNLMFGEGTEFAKYALTVYKGDKDAGTVMGAVGQADFYKEILSPLNAYSSGTTLTYEWDMLDNYAAGDKIIDAPTPSNVSNDAYKSLMGVPYTDIYGKADLMDFYILKDNLDLTKDQIRALPESPIKTTVNYIATITQTFNHPPLDWSYDTQLLDNYIQTNLGRATQTGDAFIIKTEVTDFGSVLFDIYIYYNNVWKREMGIGEENAIKIENMGTDPRPYIGLYNVLATNVQTPNIDYHSYGIGFLKDCREQISINYNLQLVSSSDTFVVSPFIFSPNKSNLKFVVLNEEVNKLTDGYLNTTSIIKNVYNSNDELFADYKFNVDFSSPVYPSGFNPITLGTFMLSTGFMVFINNKHFTNTEGYERIKSFAIIYDEIGASQITGKTKFILARNIPDDWTQLQASREWCFGNPKKNELFKNKQ